MQEIASDGRAKLFADNVKRLRVERGWTQTDLARAMKARGFRFHQQTVQRVEELSRLVRLDEAYALSEILQTTVDQMSWDHSALRQQELQSLMLGASTLTTALTRAASDWFRQCGPLTSHVVQLLDHEPGSGQLQAGLTLLARVIDAIDDADSTIQESVATPFLAHLTDGTSDSRDPATDTVPDDEQLLRAIVEQHHTPSPFAALTTEQVGDIYLAPIEKDRDNPKT